MDVVNDNSRLPRRALLAGLIGGLGAAVASAVGRAGPVAAHAGDVKLGVNNTASNLTKITSTTGSAFAGFGNGNGTGVAGESNSGNGVAGYSLSGSGVLGESDSSDGVRALSLSGIGLYASNEVNNRPAGLGQSRANNTGFMGFSGGFTDEPPKSPSKTGLCGVADQDENATGVRGTSKTGRGAIFEGKTAQARLRPSRAATHPSSGLPGDLFVDASHRLWFCKGGAAWTQLA